MGLPRHARERDSAPTFFPALILSKIHERKCVKKPKMLH